MKCRGVLLVYDEVVGLPRLSVKFHFLMSTVVFFCNFLNKKISSMQCDVMSFLHYLRCDVFITVFHFFCLGYLFNVIQTFLRRSIDYGYWPAEL